MVPLKTLVQAVSKWLVLGYAWFSKKKKKRKKKYLKYEISNNSNIFAINEWEHLLALWSDDLKTID